MNLKNLLAILLAIAAGYVCVKVLLWLIGVLFSIVFGALWLMLIIVLAIPFYILFRVKWLR